MSLKRPEPFWFLENLTTDCETLLDIGCGRDSPVKIVKNKKTVGVDGFLPYIIQSKNNSIHTDYVLCDVRHLCFKEKSVDCAAAFELIEHLTREEGIELVKNMEHVAKRNIVLSTPNGWLEQDEFDGNKLQHHKSSWVSEDFKELGYTVFGINGMKLFRGRVQTSCAGVGSKSKLNFLNLLLNFASTILRRVVFYFPSTTSGLLAVKIAKNNQV